MPNCWISAKTTTWRRRLLSPLSSKRSCRCSNAKPRPSVWCAISNPKRPRRQRRPQPRRQLPKRAMKGQRAAQTEPTLRSRRLLRRKPLHQRKPNPRSKFLKHLRRQSSKPRLQLKSSNLNLLPSCHQAQSSRAERRRHANQYVNRCESQCANLFGKRHVNLSAR